MNFRGIQIDPAQLWGNYVEFPPNADLSGEFAPLVYCPNPDHDNERSPAFQINLTSPRVHCFSNCGISGSYEHAICLIRGYYDEFKVFKVTGKERLERKRQAYRKARKEIRKDAKLRGGTTKLDKRAKKGNRKRDGEQKPTETFSDLSVFTFLPEAAVNYLNSRGIDESTIADWQLGWNPENLRIVIPAFDENKKLQFVIQRAIKEKDQPKYLYPEESGEAKKRLLFGACMLDRSLVQSEGLILVEGSFDVLKLYQHGFHNSAAILGSSITRFQRNIISRMRPKRVVLFFDRDSGGISAILSASWNIRKPKLLVARYPKGKSDPAELSRKEVERAISRAIPISKILQKLPEASKQRRKRFHGKEVEGSPRQIA